MTTITDPPKESFRLSMLIYDTRYRSATIQVAALFGFMLLAAWLINNTVQNLATLGKPLGFDFLTTTVSYDINQRLIAYDSQSTHLRAAFVGLINTLLVAVLGCALASVMGIVIGALRLSKNWLVASIMTVYVELFRNVPVLLWVVFIMAVLIETLPAPSAFRGEDSASSMLFGQSVALTNRGFYVPEPMFTNGFGDMAVLPNRDSAACEAFYGGSPEKALAGDSCGAFQISLDLVAFLLVLGAGIVAAHFVKRRADRIQEATGDRPTTWHVRAARCRSTPWRFIAENVRAGILAVSRGQSEAAFALGLRPSRTMNLVILPQALRVPPLISQYLNLTKNSSLAIAVGYMDITGTLGGITMNQTGRELECVMLLMLVYLAISLSISSVMNWYNNRVKLVER